MAIRDQLEAIAPLSSSKNKSKEPVNKTAEQPPDKEVLPVHFFAIVFGAILCLAGMFSGKPGVLVLGLIVGGSVVLMGFLPYFRSNKKGQERSMDELAHDYEQQDEYNFSMTDKEWKWEGIRQWLKKNHHPPEIFLPSPIRSRHEQRFALTLHEFFPHNIITDRVIELFKKNNAYHPDFTFVEGDAQLYIDIEIDEPYASRGSQPTHYCQPDGTGPDAVRNAYFLQKGWVVVRFCEQQIALYPEECCKFIARLVFQLTGNDTHWERWSYSHPQLPLVPLWTKEEAEKMAKENYRGLY